MIRTEASSLYMPVWRNGRRMGLKIPGAQARVGSSPTTGTLTLDWLDEELVLKTSKPRERFQGSSPWGVA